MSDLVAPGIDGADVMARTGVDDLQEIALLAHRRGVQGQPAMIVRKIPHQRMIRKSVQRFSLATNAERVCAEIMRNQKAKAR
jgi:hypothetical protein